MRNLKNTNKNNNLPVVVIYMENCMVVDSYFVAVAAAAVAAVILNVNFAVAVDQHLHSAVAIVQLSIVAVDSLHSVDSVVAAAAVGLQPVEVNIIVVLFVAAAVVAVALM